MFEFHPAWATRATSLHGSWTAIETAARARRPRPQIQSTAPNVSWFAQPTRITGWRQQRRSTEISRTAACAREDCSTRSSSCWPERPTSAHHRPPLPSVRRRHPKGEELLALDAAGSRRPGSPVSRPGETRSPGRPPQATARDRSECPAIRSGTSASPMPTPFLSNGPRRANAEVPPVRPSTSRCCMARRRHAQTARQRRAREPVVPGRTEAAEENGAPGITSSTLDSTSAPTTWSPRGPSRHPRPRGRNNGHEGGRMPDCVSGVAASLRARRCAGPPR